MGFKIGILGCGNMGAAIANGLKDRYQIFVFDKDPLKTNGCVGVTVSPGIEELVNSASTAILAIKPQDFDPMLAKISTVLTKPLLVSIAAGISTAHIEARVPDARVIRVMPNLAVTVQAGMSCLCKGKDATTVDLSFIQSLFNRLGKTLIIDERHMNAVTAVSGSGPGFFFDLIRIKPKEEWESFGKKEFTLRLSQAAQTIGLSIVQANLLAEATALGSLALLKQSGASPDVLCIRVASRGGTTEAGLKVLKGRIGNLEPAVKAAWQRAAELAQK